MTKERYKEIPESEQSTSIVDDHQLILLNDDEHTFEYVIDALVDICNHTAQQATQCTLIIHYKGSCDVKVGSFDELRPLRRALLDKELRAKIV
jgi:ATP-dependent Clp protease adaptor protein ClpS